MLSWFCCAGSLCVAYLFAKGARKKALWLSLFMQFPWGIMAYYAGQWGALTCAFAFAGIDIWGLTRR